LTHLNCGSGQLKVFETKSLVRKLKLEALHMVFQPHDMELS
jgi:hypothetical protein